MTLGEWILLDMVVWCGVVYVEEQLSCLFVMTNGLMTAQQPELTRSELNCYT